MTDFSSAITVAAANTDMNVAKRGPLTQVELEKEMSAFGKTRAENMMGRNEDAGSADNNPYAKAIYRRFIMPLAALIREDVGTKKPGRNQAHVTLLEPLDPEAVAFLSVRSVLNSLMSNSGHDSSGGIGRTLMAKVGRSLYGELLLSMFAEIEPDLFYTLNNDLGRRMSKSERHKVTVFRMQALQAGVPLPEWGANGVAQVGAYILDRLELLGMVDVHKVQVAGRSGKAKAIKTHTDVVLSEAVTEIIANIKTSVIETLPYFLPCIEQPKDWVSVLDGGFHTNDIRRLQPSCIRTRGATWSDYESYDLSRVFSAINGLQHTEWQINGQLLDAVRQIARHYDTDEIIGSNETAAPGKPEWLGEEMTQSQMSPDEEQEFTAWKAAKREWYTQRKIAGTKFGRFSTALAIADKFRRFETIYFVYFADFRGRLYAQTTGVSPQGSDLQKALLRFAKGKPLDTLDAQRWFLINGANKWKYDKESLDDRVKLIQADHDAIMAIASDPVAHPDWRDADSPLQFLAWCFEYKQWQDSPHDFVSHLPVGMDGSCNGLQNFSAMLRDEIGGKATNLVPSSKPNDIYQNVGDVTLLALRRETPRTIPMVDEDDPETASAAFKATLANKHLGMWIKHGCPRGLVKRSVMTLPYGSTRYACADFIKADYLREGKAPEFAKEEYGAAAQLLSHYVWDSIGEVVVKATEAMSWLQSNVKKILETNDHISWVAPDGFPVIQIYQSTSMHRINTKLQGNTKIALYQDKNEPCVRQHKNGIAPNFIHSHDAAHMKLVINAAAYEGLSLAMIHDDYGTHAADAAKLYRIIREEFVAMYEQNDPLADIQARYDLTQPPARGNLDLRQVLDSAYFFS